MARETRPREEMEEHGFAFNIGQVWGALILLAALFALAWFILVQIIEWREQVMKTELRDLILRILGGHRIMAIATNRADGWPQATTVGYANDGFKIYFYVARVSQKFLNIQRDPRVSIAIGNDFVQPLDIKGLSLAGRAEPIEERNEFECACMTMLERYPEYAAWPKPSPALSPLMRVTPGIISIVDYSKGFGHSDLVKVSRDDIEKHIESPRHDWRWRAA